MKNTLNYLKVIGGIIVCAVLAPAAVWLVAVVWKLYKLFFAAVFPHSTWLNGDPVAGDLATVALIISGLFVLAIVMCFEAEGKEEKMVKDATETRRYCEICGETIKMDESSFHFIRDGKQFDYCENCRSKVYYTAGESVKSGA